MKPRKNETMKTRLRLDREVVRVLQAHELEHVAGGFTKMLTGGSDQVCCA